MSRTKQPLNVLKKEGTGKPTGSWKERIHPEDLEQLKNTFELFDEDRSGFIDPEEIGKIMEELGDSRKGSVAYNIIDGLRYKNKPINFDEFVELVAPKIGEVKTKEGIKAIYKHLDLDDDDYINYDEIKKLAKLSGDSINDDEILELLHSAFINQKTNNNEGLYFEEFYRIVTGYYKKVNK
eukprot:TRINITY_DN3322_c0_g1_i1.p1 TRINITY_DN3322_c0_g1~~TRINITY_DN3322_c0_g1_i1.p1  ORF type:complete len:181 (+),score=29.73 TRINITY_DN3322_c0_g1_i1:19-561(+)